MQTQRWTHFPCPKYFKDLLSNCKHKPPVTQLHSLIITTSLVTNSLSIAISLIASYTSIGLIVSARKLFDQLPQRTLQAYNSMIIAYSRENESHEVLNLYNEMVKVGIRPDSSTFTIALKACGVLKEFEMGDRIWGRAVEDGYDRDVFVGASVLNLYTKCGKIDEAKMVFERMVKKDVVCWSTMITGFVRSGRALEGIEFYRRMRNEGVEGDGFETVGMIQACANLGGDYSRLGLSIHGYMIRRVMLMNDVVVQTSLVNMYAKNGNLDVALRVFRRMPRKSCVSWGALISGFAQNGFAEDALDLLDEMQRMGFKPDSVCVLGSVLACSQVGYLKLGKSLHAYIVRSLEFGCVSGTALIDMYAKCGELTCSRLLFDQIHSRDLILWNTMIASYGIHGRGKEALSLFLDMREAKLKPDDATFTSLLSAFSHSGMVEEGRYWSNFMVNESKIQPTEKHYACMVDLLSRAGHIEEAYQLITSMEVEPRLVIWVSLLSGCLNHGKFVLGEIAAKKILELNPEDLGVYALVSNFLSIARNWDEAAVLKNIIKRRGGLKIPGYSAVEVNGQRRVFLMEDMGHHMYAEVKLTLKRLFQEMRMSNAPEMEFS